MKEKLRIGIIDDDKSKVTQIITRLIEGVDEASPEKQQRYCNYEFEPYELDINDDLNKMLEQIIELDLDCIIVDYKLSSYAVADYTGIELAKNLEDRILDYPIFVLTSYEDDLFRKEVYNAYQVFDVERYLKEKSERIELHFKIIEQILKTQKQKAIWESEIKRLLPLAGSSEDIDSRLVELDTKLEKSINGTSSLPLKVKKDLNSNKLNEILEKIDLILEREKCNGKDKN